MSNHEQLQALIHGRKKTARTHEQNVMATMVIIRRMVHPEARVKKHIDGTYTITSPPEGGTS